VVSEAVTYVNAPLLARDRGLEVRLTTSPDSPDYRNLITVRGTLPTGEQVSVSGTLTGVRHIEKLTEIDGFDLEIPPAEHMTFFRYDDRPGIVGAVGRVLGAAGVNIAGMQVSRRSQGGEALMALTVDTSIPPAVLDEIATEIGSRRTRAVDLEV